MTDKSKASSQIKHIPKDAQVIMSIMREMEITEFEPRVINQLLEFTYKYVACILEDAKTYANHGKKKSIDLEDVKLALQIQLEQVFTFPPPRELLAELARCRNCLPLPLIKSHCGIRLPQDKYCLSSCNLKIKLPQFGKKNMKANTYPHSLTDRDRNVKLPNKPNLNMMKRTIPIVARTQAVTLSKPAARVASTAPKAVIKPKINISQNATTFDDNQSNQLKRKRDDDDYNGNL